MGYQSVRVNCLFERAVRQVSGQGTTVQVPATGDLKDVPLNTVFQALNKQGKVLGTVVARAREGKKITVLPVGPFPQAGHPVVAAE